jgi:hypothetical protein
MTDMWWHWKTTLRVFSFGFSSGIRLSFADVSEPSVKVHLQRLDEEYE